MSHRWKIVIAVAIVVLIFTGLWLATMHFQPESAVDVYKKLLLARGEKLKIGEVLPPPVPPEQNGAEVVRTAFALFAPSGYDYSNFPPTMLMVAPGLAMVCFRQPDFHGQLDFSSWTNAEAAVEENRPATETLWQMMNYPAIDFQLAYRQAPDLRLPHLAPLKRCAQRLSAAAMCDLHLGDPASATTNLCALLALVHGERGERLLISQLVRIAMAHIAADANWELLQATNVSDPQLARLQKSWERLEFVEAMENSLLMERADTETLITRMRDSDEYFHNWVGTYRSGTSSTSSSSGDWWGAMKEGWNNLKFAGAVFMWHTSWSFSDELRMLKGDQVILETLRAIHTNRVFFPSYTNMAAQLTDLGIKSENIIFPLDVNLRWLFSRSSLALAATVRKTMAAEVTRRVVITAIALKRYHLKHGNYPAALSELVPEFLSSVPRDPVDGKPLRYRRNADGTFLLYSVGENGKDDGGNPALEPGAESSYYYWLNPQALDWVWPQPATPAVVQKYYERHSKDSAY